MKSTTNSLLRLTGVLALGAVVLLSACGRSDKTSDTTMSTTPTTSAAQDHMQTAMTAATARWDDIKDYSYDQRAEFAARTSAMAARLDQQSTMAQGAASRELADARDELRTAASEVSNATAETWESTKERVGRAWQKAEASFASAAE